ncbi:MAG: FAD-binding oxidoreductase [Chloroflexi bacterium]|nr:FAD-binding oxidoreductase [Chloroflexota bacterium]
MTNLPLDEAEVLIIGAGIAGCSLAYFLAKRGVRVIVLEKWDVASEASGRAGGGVRSQNRQGPELPLMKEGIDLWQSFSRGFKTDTGFMQCGNLYVAETPEDMAEVEADHAKARQAGLDVHLVTARQVKELVPSLEMSVQGGTLSPRDGHTDPAQTTRAIAREAQELGARIITGVTVTDILVQGGTAAGILTHDGSLVKAPIVVNCAGVWAPRLAKKVGVPLPMKTIRGVTTTTESANPVVPVSLRSKRISIAQRPNGGLRFADGTVGKGKYCYDLGLEAFERIPLWFPIFWVNRQELKFRLNPDLVRRDFLRLLKNSRDRWGYEFPSHYTLPIDWKQVRKRKQRLDKVLPAARSLRTELIWSGLTNMLPDMLPAIGPAGPKGHYIISFSGKGISLGPIAGKLVAEWIADGRPSIDLMAFDPNRFRSIRSVSPKVYR